METGRGFAAAWGWRERGATADGDASPGIQGGGCLTLRVSLGTEWPLGGTHRPGLQPSLSSRPTPALSCHQKAGPAPSACSEGEATALGDSSLEPGSGGPLASPRGRVARILAEVQGVCVCVSKRAGRPSPCLLLGEESRQWHSPPHPRLNPRGAASPSESTGR